MAKKKRMTIKEKERRAQLKKELQESGVLPPDKAPLNRKKFISEAEEEWKSRSYSTLGWEYYLTLAAWYMLLQKDGRSRRVSAEAVGAAKLLKVALRLHDFSQKLQAEGKKEYKLMEQYDYIKDILEA